ncbi:DUF3854 domain-containing protein [Urbifossiella limnaea]|uniref:DUF3854 domain-containing protein n=1 Tax=Urbifossiella limnaea TaxID=2528023 RepID=UPI00192E714F|nr:DUF3854 domain-containing protein [Urbifossiella limnaea]
MSLTPGHRADLAKSGLTDATIIAAGLHSILDSSRVRELLGDYLSRTTANKMGACLAFPYLDAAGEPMTFANGDGTQHPFVRLKPSAPRTDKKNKDRKIKYESPAAGPCRAYLPPWTRAALADPTVALLITEGEKKALCADQHGLPCVGLGGVWAWQKKRDRDADGKGTGPRELIPDLDGVAWPGRKVFITFDSDLTDKLDVQWAEYHLADVLRQCGADVRVVRLPAEPDGSKNGLDDYLVLHGPDELRKLVAAAVAPARPTGGDDRPKIIIGTDQYRVNAEAIAALAAGANVYQRGNMLVRAVRTETDPDPNAVVRRPPGSPVVRPLPPPLLRELFTRCARWVQLRGKPEKQEEVPAHPPEWCVSAVHVRERWPGIRHLEAVVDHPVILRDGTILGANGYDPRSQLLVSVPAGLRITVPDRPTPADLAAAVAAIDDVIQNFPFEKPEHRAAWFAGLLTPLAWFAFDGPAPLLLIDGNTRGCGKGLLADVIALIVTGRRFPVMSYTADKEELRKKITSLAMEGERLVLLDNLAGAVGNDVLDMALTADRWKDRVLGVNKVFDGPLNVAWYATGNNVQLHADTSRRCSHCRIETQHERPELRDDVKYKDLRAHVREYRGPLLSAALTILRGWFAAGTPRHNLAPWGSFEGWSGVVREAVVFAGLPDPGETRLALQTTADRDAMTMSAMIDAMERMDPDRKGLTAAGIIDAVRKPSDRPPEWFEDLKSAVEELCGKLDGRVLGYRFRAFARRNFGGRMIDRAPGVSSNNSARWIVKSVGGPARAGSSPVSPASPAPAPTGDAGDTGDDPAQPGNAKGAKPTRRRFKNDDREHDQRGAK